MPKIVTGYPPDGDFDRAVKAGLGSIADDSEDTEDTAAGAEGKKDDQDESSPTRLLQLAQAAERQGVTFAQQFWHPAWEKNYKAFRSEYTDRSKYKSDDYRHRSKMYRPKSRIAVTKDLAGAAQTLFATVDAVTVEPGDETDQMQVANAEVLKQLINYRLDRTSGSNAIPWFLTAMGARQDCQIAGVCVSKSYWNFVQHPTKTDKQGRKKRIKDKPSVDLVAPENVILDVAADWTDPVQSGAYFAARYPMHITEVKGRMSDPRVPWKKVSDQLIWDKAKINDFDAAAVRRSREGGADRLEDTAGTDKELQVVWVYEWFIRTVDGDWNFWTLGRDTLLSDPVDTEEAYPWRGGERPYRIGYGNLEAHRIVPQSAIETLRPLQDELNEITNLRLDNLKQVIQPVALIKRGKKIDTDGLKRRYPVLFVENPKEDVQWDRPPDSAASSFAETSRIDTDFDDLAGVFNGGSVANNRQVGETVGGMRLMQGASSAVSEFYVRLWVETWVEPVLSDIAKLEAYYEDDEKIVALASKRASLFKKFGIDEVTDDLLSQEVIVRVSAGVGSPDPMQKQAKVAQAVELTSKVMAGSPRFLDKEITLNEKALIDEIWGNAGYRDAFDRFFIQGQPQQQPGQGAGKITEAINFKDLPPDGKVQLAAKVGIQLNPAGVQAAGDGGDAAAAATNAQTAQSDNDHKMAIETLRSKTKIVSDLIKHGGARDTQRHQHRHENKQAFMDTLMGALKEHHGVRDRAADRDARAAQGAQQSQSGFPAAAA